MPRFQVDPAPAPELGNGQFDLCARCAVDETVRVTVARKKAGLPLDSSETPAVVARSHTSYDFSPRPVPCVSCARILTAEDD